MMHTWFLSTRQSARVRRPSHRPMLESLEQRCLLDTGIAGFVETNLVSDMRGVAAHTDANLVNP